MDSPKRKSPRLRGYDYSSPGGYFVTSCTADRKCILSRVVGGDVHDAPQIELSTYGKTADQQLRQMDAIYTHISVERAVIMLNHIHLLLMIHGGPTGTSAPTKTRQHQAVADFVFTFKRFCNKVYGENIWQRSYHDHVIRGEGDYAKIGDCITHDPARWTEDCFYTT